MQPLDADIIKAYRRHGIIVATEEDIEWVKWNIDDVVIRKVQKELINIKQ